MTQTVFEKMKTAISVLKLDFTTEEFATFADDQELSEESIEAVQAVFSYISEKKQQTTVQTLLKLSRLPKKEPKTFEILTFHFLKAETWTGYGRCHPWARFIRTAIWPLLDRLEQANHTCRSHLAMPAPSMG